MVSRQRSASPPRKEPRPGPATKTRLPCEKARWHPSLLLDQIILVSSRSSLDESHAARKSWLTMVSAEPPMLALSCKLSHRTAINILETREFVINIPSEELLPRLMHADDEVAIDARDVDAAPWSFIPSEVIGAPRVEQCRGHLECVLHTSHRIGDEAMMFIARIVNVSIDRDLTTGDASERYRQLRPVLYLEEGLVAGLDRPRAVAE